MQKKTFLFSVQIEMPLANALKSKGYTDKLLILTIGKSDIYQHKSLGKWKQIFIWVLENRKVTNKYWNCLPTYLNFSVIDIGLTKIW